jgi:hypothetical protein
MLFTSSISPLSFEHTAPPQEHKRNLRLLLRRQGRIGLDNPLDALRMTNDPSAHCQVKCAIPQATDRSSEQVGSHSPAHADGSQEPPAARFRVSRGIHGIPMSSPQSRMASRPTLHCVPVPQYGTAGGIETLQSQPAGRRRQSRDAPGTPPPDSPRSTSRASLHPCST